MRFKSLIIATTLFVSSVVGWVHELRAAANDLSPNYLGLILRPHLLKKISDRVSSLLRASDFRSIYLCQDGRGRQIQWKGEFDEPSWEPVGNAGSVSLQIPFSKLRVKLFIYNDCRYEKQMDFLELDESSGSFTALWTLSKMTIDFNLEFNNQAQIVPLRTSFSKKVDEILTLGEAQLIAKSQFLAYADREASLWIKEKFRNLLFEQSAMESLGDQALWKSGLLVENGAIRLELLDAKPEKQDLTFAFFPRNDNAFLTSNNSVGLFFNALILNKQQVDSLQIESPNQSLKAGSTSRSVKPFLARYGHTLKEAPLQLPEMKDSSSDLTVVLHQELVNSALHSIYREGLLRFRTSVDIGHSTKGVIADEALDTSTIISIHPRAAPQVKFDQDRFQLQVSGYRMNLGTWIEDRIIPSTEIEADSSISASLKVDSKSSLVLDMEPDKFFLNLKELKGRMTEDDVAFFKTLANKIWIHFLRENSRLFIFPFVLSTEDEESATNDSVLKNIKYSVSRAELVGPNIVLDINADLEKWSW